MDTTGLAAGDYDLKDQLVGSGEPEINEGVEDLTHRGPLEGTKRMFHQQFMKEYFLFGGAKGKFGVSSQGPCGQNH